MRRAAVLLLGLVSAACATAGRASPARDGLSIDVDGVARAYRLHVPAGAPRTGALPVLFVFHGAGSDAADVARGSGFDAMADAAGLLVVYPEGGEAGRRFDVDPPAGRESADVRLFEVLLESLRGRFSVDPKRVYASGFSNGAALCYRLAAERPVAIAAIAPVAGYLPALVRRPPVVPVPLIAVHGTADDRVEVPALAGDGRSPVETWARWNGCAGPPATSTQGAAGSLVVRLAAWSGPTPRSDATLVLVEGARHEWPGGPGGPVSRMVLDFLLRHARP